MNTQNKSAYDSYKVCVKCLRKVWTPYSVCVCGGRLVEQ